METTTQKQHEEAPVVAGLQKTVEDAKARLKLDVPVDPGAFIRTSVDGNYRTGRGAVTPMRGDAALSPAPVTSDLVLKILAAHGVKADAGVDVGAMRENVALEKKYYDDTTKAGNLRIADIIAAGHAHGHDGAAEYRMRQIAIPKQAWQKHKLANHDAFITIGKNLESGLHKALLATLESELKQAASWHLPWVPSLMLTTIDSAISQLNNQMAMLQRSSVGLSANEVFWGIPLRIIQGKL